MSIYNDKLCIPGTGVSAPTGGDHGRHANGQTGRG